MINTDQLKQLFQEKLAATGSLDDAFTKAVWVAYSAGFDDGCKPFTRKQEIEDARSR
jgi:hypothetical protein